MKKKIFVIALCVLLLCGCKKEKEKVASWDVNLSGNTAYIEEEDLEVFNKANDRGYELVGLLAKQVVSGTNYMFLVKDDGMYKVVVVYNNLEGNVRISHVNEFDFSKYTNEQIDYKSNDAVGSWFVEIPADTGITFDSKVQSIYEDAVSKLSDVTYKPIALLGTQLVSGTNYAVLAYGYFNLPYDNSGIYVLTVYEDLNGTREVVSSAFVDLSEYNK